MAKIPPHIIDEILSTARIEEVIGEFVHLKRAGSNLKGLSPFTDEKTPSFMVSPSKQIFKCFSTGIGGNVVSFLMEKEHYSYPEALKWLADKYNIELPEDKPLSKEEMDAISERESLYIVNKFAKEYFHETLINTEEGKAIGLSYFTERGFRKETIEQFELGYCLDAGDDFTKQALQKGYKLEYLEKVGVTKTKDERHFDFFRGRAMFPIHSVTGRILGFGGRTLRNDKKIAKYFNSPESIIYNKSEILYGLYFAKGDIIKYDNCFLVEGYADVISMHQSGIKNVVASSGTSLTKGQIKLIRRYTNNITILYDGDAAGIHASFRGIDLILEEGLTVQVVLFPDGEDPDSFAQKSTTEELSDFIEKSKQDFISFKADILLENNGDDPIQKTKLIHDIVNSISLIPDSVSRSIYSQRIAERFDIESRIINAEIAKLIVKNKEKERQNPPTDTSELLKFIDHKKTTFENHDSQTDATEKISYVDYMEKDLIRILLKYGTNAVEIQANDESKEISVAELICNEIEKDILSFDNSIYQEVYQIIATGLKNHEIFESSYFLRNHNPKIVSLVTEFESSQYELSHNWLNNYNISVDTELDKLKTAVFQAIYSFKIAKINQIIKDIRSKLNKNNLTELELEELLKEQVLFEKIKVTISEKMDRTMNNSH